ncbi:MAG: LamG-like jellyroll fold domain-containing protein [Anaerohalosphaeraceae bacterium]
MRKIFIMLPLFLIASVYGDIVGSDYFDYPDGAIAGRIGGYGWDWKGVGNPQGTSPTSWMNMASGTDIVNGRLVLTETGSGWIAARREFGSDTWGTGAFQAKGIVCYAVTLTVNEAQGWIEFSAMDGTNDRIQYGMPWQSGGLGFFGLCNKNSGVKVYTTIPVEVEKAFRIVAVLDFDGNSARMWVNPDSGDYDTSFGTSADVVYNNLGMWNWVNGVRISSGGKTTWDDLIVATTFAETFVPGSLNSRPQAPSPAAGAVDVAINAGFSWTVAKDPNGLVDPNLVSMKLYMATDKDPNFVFKADILSWDAGTLRAVYTPSAPLQRDTSYLWRVDSIKDDAQVVTGDIWTFDAEKSVPKITGDPVYQVVPAGTSATFTVIASSISTPTYQWYKYVDGTNDLALTNAGDISGTKAVTLTIANVELADEGAYYCVVNNDSGVPATSKQALLGVKRTIAYWPFENNDLNSTIAGSPASVVYGDPAFVTEGIVGAALAFDADSNAQDLIYTEPEKSSYFDICNYTMTVACWIKASSAGSWNPMVARNGENGEGWQLRQREDTKRVCFTTRGTGNDDGTASNRTIFDGKWHYVVGTYDGAAKKVYIDGILSRVYNADNGSVQQEYDAVSGLIGTTASPVALAGRVQGAPGNLNIQNTSVIPCTLDDVAIYNYALDAVTIAQNYASITGTAVCPNPSIPANDLTGDCIVNMNDLAELASEWLLDTSVKPLL